MKYNAIHSFIETFFQKNDVDWFISDVLDEGELVIHFMNSSSIGDWNLEDYQPEIYFTYVKTEYYSSLEDGEIKRQYLPDSPLLSIPSSQFTDTMDKLFADKWKPGFETWFIRRFPQFPVKTFLY